MHEHYQQEYHTLQSLKMGYLRMQRPSSALLKDENFETLHRDSSNLQRTSRTTTLLHIFHLRLQFVQKLLMNTGRFLQDGKKGLARLQSS